MAEPQQTADALSVLERNVAAVRGRIERAACRAGRSAGDVELVAVTKGVPARIAAACARLGLAALGENRADALEAKAQALASEGIAVRWHFLGHLQRNKARRVAPHVHTLHSLDSVALLETLERLAREFDRRIEAYVELHLGDEATRTGLGRDELETLLRACAGDGRIALRGLMTMAPLVEGEDERARLDAARARFRELRELARSIEADRALAARFVDARVRTSMGMSGDFEVAIEEGSDCVRVGSALFEGVALDDATGNGGSRDGRSAA